MGFATGRESKETEFKLYTGVAPVYVMGVSPSKKELEKIYGRPFENDPEYVNKGDESTTVRLDFILRTDVEKTGIELTTKLALFVSNVPRWNKDKTKVQVIDKYGRTAWVTKEEFKEKKIPVYSSGTANLDKDYRPAYVGEEDLTGFIKTYLGIPNINVYKDGQWSKNPNVKPEDCEARLDVASFEKLFKGDFSDIKNILEYQPNNRIKVVFGVNTKEDRQYQTVYSRKVFSLNANAAAYSRLAAEIDVAKASGAFSTVEFTFDDLHEYNVKPTEFKEESKEDNPFDDLEMPFLMD